jgi:hypothetical protein
MSIDFDNLDRSHDDELKGIEGLFYLPWIGAQYRRATEKVMIVAESVYVYEPNESARAAVSKRDFVRLVVSEHGLDFDLTGGPIRNLNLARNVESFIADGEMSRAERQAFWPSIVYHEHVQRPLSSLNERPTPRDYADGAPVLRRVVEFLRPTVIIYLGTDLKKVAPFQAGFDPPLTRLASHAKIDRCVPRTGAFLGKPFIMIRQPARYFSWSRWAAFFRAIGYEWSGEQVRRRADSPRLVPDLPRPEDGTPDAGGDLGATAPRRQRAEHDDAFGNDVVSTFTRDLKRALEEILGDEWVVYNEFELPEQRWKRCRTFEMGKHTWRYAPMDRNKICIGMVPVDGGLRSFGIGVIKGPDRLANETLRDLLDRNVRASRVRSDPWWIWRVPVDPRYRNWDDPGVLTRLRQGNEALAHFKEEFRTIIRVAKPVIDREFGPR